MRLIGDGRRTDLYNKPIGEKQAQDVAGLMYKYCPVLDGKKPYVYFDSRKLRKCGGALPSGEITLYANGRNWGTLAHELTHLAEGCMNHSPVFKYAHCQILDEMEEMARNSTITY